MLVGEEGFDVGGEGPEEGGVEVADAEDVGEVFADLFDVEAVDYDPENHWEGHAVLDCVIDSKLAERRSLIQKKHWHDRVEEALADSLDEGEGQRQGV